LSHANAHTIFATNIRAGRGLARTGAKPAHQRQGEVASQHHLLEPCGWSAAKLAEYFGHNAQSIHNDFDRFEQHGVAGLVDGKAKGAASTFTVEIETLYEG
jgi:hypothetical protein